MAKTAEKSKSFEATTSQSQSTEESNSDTETRSTSSEQSTSETSETNWSVSASGGLLGVLFSAGAGGSESETTSKTNTNSNEKSSTKTSTRGSESSYGLTSSSGSSDSSTNSDSFTNTASKQKSITTNICNEGSESSSNSNGQESNRDQSNERNTGTTFDKSFEIPGDSRSVSNSKAVSETDEFFQEFSGSISHTEASCVKYSASLNKAIKEKRGDQSVQDGTSNDNCNNEDIENRVKSALETREEDLQTYGGGAGEDIYQWTTNNFLSPTLLPDFKLQPIVKLFQPNFMNRKMVTRKDGTAINHKRILSWLMPRYAILIGRCRLMKNHHASEGKACVPNEQYLVSTRDALDTTHLADACQSLPDHVLEKDAIFCKWCPAGVDHARRTCKPDSSSKLKLYQQWEKKEEEKNKS